jgi:hypothetical protein
MALPGSSHRRLTRALVAVLTLLAATLAPAAGASAAEKGLQTDLTWGVTAADQQRTMQVLEGSGLGWIRLDISWASAELSPGVYDDATLAMTDHALALAEAAGAKVIMMVNETPQWASGSTNRNTPPRDPADYARFMRDMAARYAGRVAAWEVWNEPNHPRFWHPAPDAAAYARLLEAAFPAIRAGDPAAKVVFGGIAFNDYEYLERVYAAAPGIGDSFDVMATHPYTAGGGSPAEIERTDAGRMTTTSFLAFEEVRRLMSAHGDERPIWLTEFGWSTNSNVLHPLGGVSEAVQATYLGDAFELLEAYSYVQVAIVYNLRNNYWADDADNWDDQLGLLRTDFSPKLAYAVFEQYTPPSGDAPDAPPSDDAPQPAGPPPTVVEEPPGSGPPLPALAASPSRGRSITLSVHRLDPATARIARTGSGRARYHIHGRLSMSAGGHVRLVLERHSAGMWRRARSIRVAVHGSRYSYKLAVRGGERHRVTVFHKADGARMTAGPVRLRG